MALKQVVQPVQTVAEPALHSIAPPVPRREEGQQRAQRGGQPHQQRARERAEGSAGQEGQGPAAGQRQYRQQHEQKHETRHEQHRRLLLPAQQAIGLARPRMRVEDPDRVEAAGPPQATHCGRQQRGQQHEAATQRPGRRGQCHRFSGRRAA